ncbi:MAG: ATP-grasp domain-containing protein [Paludibacteraceae bacterium]|nr:ATP-grasp domain-containing protein [Paludibacteraceae bacterium]
MRILVGEISSYKAIVIAQYIRSYYPDVEQWAYDNKPIMNYIHTRYVNKCVCLPFHSFETYVIELADYVKKNRIDVLIPVHSDYIGAILLHKELFGTALDWMGKFEDYILLHEKDQMMAIATRLGIRVPTSYANIASAKVPFVIKPTNLSAAKGIQYYLTEKDKSPLGKLSKNIICQEYIEGIGCGYEVYCKDGRILAEYGHLRLAEWPISGGSSVLRKRYIHQSMRPIAEKLLSKVRWTGFVMFEFKLTPLGELVLIEANPRIWGSINQALLDGCPLFKPILGQPKGELPNVEVRTCLVPQIWIAMLGYLFRGRIDVVRDWLTHWHMTYRDVSFWNDPLGFISMVLRKI